MSAEAAIEAIFAAGRVVETSLRQLLVEAVAAREPLRASFTLGRGNPIR